MGALQDGFGAGEAARLSGVAIANLDYWSKSDFLRPSLQEGQGKGSRRRYSFPDIIALRVVQELREGGVSLQSLRVVIQRLRAHAADASFSNTFLVGSAGDIFIQASDQLVSALRRPGQTAFHWLIDLEAVETEIRARLQAA
jgi:DNA-binding transcriptional MerR regulator